MLLLMLVKTSRTIFALLLSYSSQPYAAGKEKDTRPPPRRTQLHSKVPEPHEQP